MTRGALYTLYVLLTLGVLFVALGNAYRFRRMRDGNELANAYVNRLMAAEFSVALFILFLLIANWLPIVRVYTAWFVWWYWIGMGILLAGRIWLALFISGDLQLREPPITRAWRWIRTRVPW